MFISILPSDANGGSIHHCDNHRGYFPGSCEVDGSYAASKNNFCYLHSLWTGTVCSSSFMVVFFTSMREKYADFVHFER